MKTAEKDKREVCAFTAQTMRKHSAAGPRRRILQAGYFDVSEFFYIVPLHEA